MKPTMMIVLCCLMAACCPNPVKPEPNPLARAQCTEIQAPADDTFGATTYTLVELAGRYKKCRAAALSDGK